MNKFTKDDLKELVQMKGLTVKEFIEKVKNHPRLSFLITTAGIWLLIQMVLGLWIAAHVVYIVHRIFQMLMS